MPQRDIRLPMAELTPLLADGLAQGQEVVITITGNSMSPFLRHRRDQAVLAAADAAGLQPGDVPLYRRRNGQYVLHRVVERRENGVCCRLGAAPCPAADAAGVQYTMLGDAQTQLEPGIRPEQIVAVATAFYRRGHCRSCDDPAYRRRVRRWHRLLPVRRWLIAAYRLPGRAGHWVARHLHPAQENE